MPFPACQHYIGSVVLSWYCSYIYIYQSRPPYSCHFQPVSITLALWYCHGTVVIYIYIKVGRRTHAISSLSALHWLCGIVMVLYLYIYISKSAALLMPFPACQHYIGSVVLSWYCSYIYIYQSRPPYSCHFQPVSITLALWYCHGTVVIYIYQSRPPYSCHFQPVSITLALWYCHGTVVIYIYIKVGHLTHAISSLSALHWLCGIVMVL